MQDQPPVLDPCRPTTTSIRLRAGTATRSRVVELSGGIDLATAPILWEDLRRLPNSTDLMVDLSGVDFMGAAGLTMLIMLRRRLTDAGTTLRLTGAQPIVVRAIQVVDLQEILPCVPAPPERDRTATA
jgi:anti-anti-sigma factor